MGREGESSENRPVLQTVRSYMVEEAKAQNRSSDDVANWSFYVPVLLFAWRGLTVENAKAEERMGLWCFYLYYCREID